MSKAVTKMKPKSRGLKPAKPKTQLYLIRLWGGVEPELYGPYETEEDRVAEATELNDEAEHSFARLDIDENGEPNIGSFLNGEIGGE